MCLRTAELCSGVDSDHMPHSAASDLGLNCLVRPVSVPIPRTQDVIMASIHVPDISARKLNGRSFLHETIIQG